MRISINVSTTVGTIVTRLMDKYTDSWKEDEKIASIINDAILDSYCDDVKNLDDKAKKFIKEINNYCDTALDENTNRDVQYISELLSRLLDD